MKTTAKLFEKDGKTLFMSKDNKTFSMCADVENESLDLTTGFVRTERMLFWVKADNEATVTSSVNALIANINKGVLKAYRAFSTEPFSAVDTPDINPSTGEVLNRYSQVRLCPAAKFDELHRQFVVNAVVAIENVTV